MKPKIVIMNVTKLRFRDAEMAAKILKEAFKDDSTFTYIFGTEKKYQRHAEWFFKTMIKCNILFGSAWISQDGGAIVLLRLRNNAEVLKWQSGRKRQTFISILEDLNPLPKLFGYIQMISVRRDRKLMSDLKMWRGWLIGTKSEYRYEGKRVVNQFITSTESPFPILLTHKDNEEVRYELRPVFEGALA